MTDQEKRKAAAIARIKAIPKRFYCTGCGCKMTLLVSLHCNCGGDIKPIEGEAM